MGEEASLVYSTVYSLHIAPTVQFYARELEPGYCVLTSTCCRLLQKVKKTDKTCGYIYHYIVRYRYTGSYVCAYIGIHIYGFLQLLPRFKLDRIMQLKRLGLQLFDGNTRVLKKKSLVFRFTV